MPLGMKGEETRTKLVTVTPSSNALLHRILAVSFATDENSDEVVRTNVAGYICVTEVDMGKGTMTVLSPQPKLPSNSLLILSDILFMDNQ
jgi:polyribonucleotide 5'-hydroxyl-kinase